MAVVTFALSVTVYKIFTSEIYMILMTLTLTLRVSSVRHQYASRTDICVRYYGSGNVRICYVLQFMK